MSMPEPGPIAVSIPAASVSVEPGGSITIPITLHNQGAQDGIFELSVQGIATPWLFMPSPVVRLAPGEERELPLTIQVPAYPHAHAGRHQLAIRVTNQAVPSEAAETHCTLTVAAVEIPGRIGLLLPATEFTVAPGQGVVIPLVLLNQGLERDVFALEIEGVPSAWVYTTSASTPLSPGQEQEVSLTIQAPAGPQAGAGRRPITIRAASQAAPGQMAEAPCGLTIASATGFRGELRPRRIEAGQPARVLVENQGNIQQTFAIRHHSLDDAVIFEPGPAQDLRVPAGQVGTAEFYPRAQKRPFFGKQISLPFTTRVEAANEAAQNLNGEVVARPLVPSWLLPVALVLILAIACAAVLIAVLGGRDGEARPTQPPAVEATATQEQAPPPEQPTEAPPEQPTEAPPEQPTEAPPEQPTEPPAEGETPEAVQLPEEGSDGGLPCAPAAFGLVLVPLAMIGRKQ